MQILHWHIPHPHPGTEASNIGIGRLSPRQGVVHYPTPSVPDSCPRIKEALLRGTTQNNNNNTTPTSTMELSIPSYLNNNVKPPAPKNDLVETDTEYDQSGIQNSNPDVLTAAGDERRHNSGEDDEPPGDHRRDNSRKRKPDPEPNNSIEEVETEDSEYIYDVKGTRYRRNDKAMLILNLYPETGRNGYTFQFFIPENDLEEARLYDESHIISYSESYLLDSINSETVPIQLLHKLESENGIDLMRYRNCVVCEVRDYRRFSNSPSSEPVVRRVVLRPTNQTIYYDFEKLIEKSYEDKKLYTKLLKARSIDYDFSVSPTKRKKWDLDYPFSNSRQVPPGSTPYDEESDGDELTLDQINELEKQLVKSIAPGLCLEPSKQVGLIANRVQFERFKWNTKELKKASEKFDLDLKKKVFKPSVPIQIDSEDDEEEISESTTTPNAQIYEQKNLAALQFPFNSLYKFLQKKANLRKTKKEDALRLPQLVYQEYPPNHIPNTSHDSMFRRISEPPGPSTFRQIFPDNVIIKTEEYLFETERRKRPHRTKLTIYQRSHAESYFGELEQEAFLDNQTQQQENQGGGLNPNFLSLRSPITMKPVALDPPTSTANGSKCQFDLGSIDSVSLYIKQFTDIFTEDGRRPCKITYQKQGQAVPHTIYTSSYKQQIVNGNNNNNSATPNNQIQTSSGPTQQHIQSQQQPQPPPLTNSNVQNQNNKQQISISISSSTSGTPTISTVSIAPTITIPTTASSSPSQSQPPVQIVHPQPRPQPIQIPTSLAQGSCPVSISIPTSVSAAVHVAPVSRIPQQQTQQSTVVNGTNVNLNLSLNSTRVIHHQQQHQRQQVLTRPQIYQTSQQPMTRPPVPVSVSVQQQSPQIITSQHQMVQPQSQGIRMKQQALATLLVAGLTGNTGPKPITVAIQPQPQNPIVSSNQLNMNQVLAIQNEGHQITHSQVVQAHQQQQHQGNQHHPNSSPIMIMLSSTAGTNGQNQIGTGTVPSHHNTPGLSVNLNTINLESLLASSGANVTQNYITSTALVNSSSNNQITMVPTNSGTVGVGNAVNILRLSNNTNTVTLQPQQILARSNPVSIMSQPQTAQLVNMNSVSTGILISNQNSNPTLTTNATIGTQRTHAALRSQPPDLQEIQVPDLNALLSSGIGPRTQQTYTSRTTPTGTSIDLNLNVNLNLSGPSHHTQPQQHHPQTASGNRATTNGQVYEHTTNGGVNVNFDESIFNALSDAIGPDLGQKLENSLVNAHHNQTTPPASSTTSPTKSSSSIITLQELLGSPPMIVQQSPSNINVPISLHHGASPLNSPQSPSITSILSPVSPNVTTSSIAYTTTPRLNALLAGTPSADSSTNATLVGSNLLERLMSAQPSSQPPTHQRPGGSRLNPIATATPNVVLDHPVLAATLTQGPQNSNPNLRQALTRPQFRQIAPAPPPSSGSTTPMVQSQQQQQSQSQQQLLNLLGIGNPVVSGPNSSPQAIRITGPQSAGPTGSNVGSR